MYSRTDVHEMPVSFEEARVSFAKITAILDDELRAEINQGVHTFIRLAVKLSQASNANPLCCAAWLLIASSGAVDHVRQQKDSLSGTVLALALGTLPFLRGDAAVPPAGPEGKPS